MRGFLTGTGAEAFLDFAGFVAAFCFVTRAAGFLVGFGFFGTGVFFFGIEIARRYSALFS